MVFRYDDLLARFETHQHRRGLRPKTIEIRRRFLHDFLSHLDPFELTSGDIDAWLDARHLANRSRVAYLSHIGVFFSWLNSEGLRADNPAAKIQRPRLPRLLPRPASDADLERALRLASPRMRAWLLLASYEGFRCFEIAGLRREAILDGEDPPLLVVEDGKGGAQRVVPLNPIVLNALQAYGLPARGPVFRVRGGDPIDAASVSSMVSKFMAKHRIPTSAHNYRHWFGTHVYRQTRDLRLVQSLMGHADPNTTAGYVAINPDVRGVDVVRGFGSEPQGTLF